MPLGHFVLGPEGGAQFPGQNALVAVSPLT